jgi:hypothetical protein
MKILLIEPDFPYPNKSKNKANGTHKNFVPLGLLKFGALHKAKGNNVKLIRGKKSKSEIGFIPNEILVTSIFTYWSNYVWDCISHYRNLFPDSVIRLGGIYATLHADKEKFKDLAKKYKVVISKGIDEEAEKYLPDYSLIRKIEYHATHMMRGCIRRCKFCGTWKIEPKMTFKSKEDIIKELKKIGKNKVVFYDNNMLANPNIKDILNSFVDLRIKGKPVIFESQSGFDGRLLEKDPELAILIRKARFQNVRMAWDNSINDRKSIKKQINLFTEAGYPAKDISVFMIYNFDTSYEDMLKKLEFCKKMGVQITDCRYRPLDLDYDNYDPHMRNGQPEGSFYIQKEAGWTDKKIRNFRSKVRKHNIEVRYECNYKRKMEKWSAIHNTFKFFNLGRPPLMKFIEKSPKLQRRIVLLNRIKNDYKSKNKQPIDLSSFSAGKLDKFIEKEI